MVNRDVLGILPSAGNESDLLVAVSDRGAIDGGLRGMEVKSVSIGDVPRSLDLNSPYSYVFPAELDGMVRGISDRDLVENQIFIHTALNVSARNNFRTGLTAILHRTVRVSVLAQVLLGC